MDYGFAPGRTSYDSWLRRLFQRRANLTLVHKKKLRTVAAFINHLHTTPAIHAPIGDIWIGAHGNAEGRLRIALDGASPPKASYEVLEAVDASGSVDLPLALRQHADGTQVAITVRFRSCRIGHAEPLVKKLKACFDGVNALTAPKHLHSIRDLPSHGSFEFLSYSFKVFRKDRYKKKADLVAAFKAAGLTFIDNSPVPDGWWDKWIPKNIQVRRIRPSWRLRLGQKIGKLSRLPYWREYRHKVRRCPFTLRGIAAKPANDAASMNALRNYVANKPNFYTNHAWPVYKRFGYSSANDFLDGWKWSFSWITVENPVTKKEEKALFCSGTRHDYEVVIPVTDPTSHNNLSKQTLYFNFYPRGGVAYAQTITLNENDARLFRTV